MKDTRGPKNMQFYLKCTAFPETLPGQKEWLKDKNNSTFFFIPSASPVPIECTRLESIIGDVTRLNPSTILKFYKKSCEENLERDMNAEAPVTTMDRWRVAQSAAESIVGASRVEWRGEMKGWLENALLRYGLKGIPKYRNAKAQYGGLSRAMLGRKSTVEEPGIGNSDTSSPDTLKHLSRRSDSFQPATPTQSLQASNGDASKASAPIEKHAAVTTFTDTNELAYQTSKNKTGAGGKRGLNEYQEDIFSMKDIEAPAAEDQQSGKHKYGPGGNRGLQEYQEDIQFLMTEIEGLAASEKRLEHLRRKKLQELAKINKEMTEVSFGKKILCERVTDLMQAFCEERRTK